jgi:hypothetical protein
MFPGLCSSRYGMVQGRGKSPIPAGRISLQSPQPRSIVSSNRPSKTVCTKPAGLQNPMFRGFCGLLGFGSYVLSFPFWRPTFETDAAGEIIRAPRAIHFAEHVAPTRFLFKIQCFLLRRSSGGGVYPFVTSVSDGRTAPHAITVPSDHRVAPSLFPGEAVDPRGGPASRLRKRFRTSHVAFHQPSFGKIIGAARAPDFAISGSPTRCLFKIQCFRYFVPPDFRLAGFRRPLFRPPLCTNSAVQ